MAENAGHTAYGSISENAIARSQGSNHANGTTSRSANNSTTTANTRQKHLRVLAPNANSNSEASGTSSGTTRSRTEHGDRNRDLGSVTPASRDVLAVAELGWRDRIKHLTWTWYTLTMATGGVANVLSQGM